MIDVDPRFMKAVRDACKGDWHLYQTHNFIDGVILVATCKTCGDYIMDESWIRKLIHPGYHCWCDR